MDIVLRAIALYVFIIVLMRIIGRRELSTLTPIDLVLLIVLGDAVQQGLTQDDYSVTGAVLAVGTIAALQVVASYLSYKFKPVRRVLEGEPVVLMEDGRFIDKNLRRNRLSPNDVAEEMRKKQIAQFSDVQWAILENTGEISFITKPDS